MKKFFAILLVVVSMFQGGVVFAADPLVNDQEPMIRTLLNFNRWLYANDYEGLRYINDNGEAAFKKALEWDNHAQIWYVIVHYPLSEGPCEFNFGTLSKPTSYFSVPCVDLATEVQVGRQVDGISPGFTERDLFDAPVKKLRKFVSDMIINKTFLDKIRESYRGNSPEALYFTLGTQLTGTPQWSFGNCKCPENPGFRTYADATQLNSPFEYQVYSQE